MHRSRRLALTALATGAFLAGLALVSCGGDAEGNTTQTTTTGPTTTTTTTTTETQPPPPPPDRPTVIRVRVVGGEPQGGIVRSTVDKGDRVVLLVTSDVADHVHLHGYDIVRDVAPGARARMAFRATVPGRFVIELEDRHAQIAELTVNP